MHPFAQVYGIELLATLHREASMLHRQFVQIKDQLPIGCGNGSVQLLRGDFLEVDWSFANLVFANSTVYGVQLFAAIEERSRLMAVGSWFVCTTRVLVSEYWTVVHKIRADMSFGRATVYFHQKIC